MDQKTINATKFISNVQAYCVSHHFLPQSFTASLFSYNLNSKDKQSKQVVKSTSAKVWIITSANVSIMKRLGCGATCGAEKEGNGIQETRTAMEQGTRSEDWAFRLGPVLPSICLTERHVFQILLSLHTRDTSKVGKYDHHLRRRPCSD